MPLARQIPLASYLWLLGSRRCCGGRIPLAYPVGEAAGFTVGVTAALAPSPFAGAVLFALGCALAYAGLVDFRRFIIPVQAIAVVALLWAWFALDRSAPQEALSDLLAGGTVAAALETLRRYFTLAHGRDSLGLGDVLLAGALALWTGPDLAPIFIAAAALMALTAAAVLQRRGPSPFGPALALAGFAAAAVRSYA